MSTSILAFDLIFFSARSPVVDTSHGFDLSLGTTEVEMDPYKNIPQTGQAFAMISL